MGKMRVRTAQLLEAYQPGDRGGHLVDITLIVLILANVVAIILETVDWIGVAYAEFFSAFEIFSVAVFTIEYLLRLWSCVDAPQAEYSSKRQSRVSWALSPLGLVDLLAIAPFYISLFIPATMTSLLMLRIFRGLRLLRLFKLTRYSPAFNVLISVVKKEARVLAVATSILFFMLIIASWGIYLLEQDIQPEHFGNIPTSMWWAVVSLTTVGYGDVVPVTFGGKIFAGGVALVGIGMMALPAAIMASGFYREVHRRSQTYQRAVEMALKDGKLSEFEEIKLEQLREELGITAEESMNTKLQVRHEKLEEGHCPHCGKLI